MTEIDVAKAFAMLSVYRTTTAIIKPPAACKTTTKNAEALIPTKGPSLTTRLKSLETTVPNAMTILYVANCTLRSHKDKSLALFKLQNFFYNMFVIYTIFVVFVKVH